MRDRHPRLVEFHRPRRVIATRADVVQLGGERQQARAIVVQIEGHQGVVPGRQPALLVVDDAATARRPPAALPR